MIGMGCNSSTRFVYDAPPGPGRYTSSRTRQVHTPSRTRQVHPLPNQAGTPPPGPGRYTPPPSTRQVHSPWKQQTPEYGQRSAGTHPTGIHSCSMNAGLVLGIPWGGGSLKPYLCKRIFLNFLHSQVEEGWGKNFPRAIAPDTWWRFHYLIFHWFLLPLTLIPGLFSDPQETRRWRKSYRTCVLSRTGWSRRTPTPTSWTSGRRSAGWSIDSSSGWSVSSSSSPPSPWCCSVMLTTKTWFRMPGVGVEVGGVWGRGGRGCGGRWWGTEQNYVGK